MDDNIKAKAEMDKAKGERYQATWNSMVEPFFDAKKEELFEAFTQLKTADTEGMMIIKQQMNALSSLRDEFMSYITTGKLASAALEEDEENERNSKH